MSLGNSLGLEEHMNMFRKPNILLERHMQFGDLREGSSFLSPLVLRVGEAISKLEILVFSL